MIRFVFLSLSLLLLCQCAHRIDRRAAKNWNENGVWKPLPGGRNEYIPADYNTRDHALTVSVGEWMTDPKDGARFFVPTDGTKQYPAGVLRGEAKKATNRYQREVNKQNYSRRIWMLPVHVLTWGTLLGDDVRSSESSGGGGESRSNSSDNSSSSGDTFPSSTNDSNTNDCKDHDGHHKHGKDDDCECKSDRRH